MQTHNLRSPDLEALAQPGWQVRLGASNTPPLFLPVFPPPPSSKTHETGAKNPPRHLTDNIFESFPPRGSGPFWVVKTGPSPPPSSPAEPACGPVAWECLIVPTFYKLSRPVLLNGSESKSPVAKAPQEVSPPTYKNPQPLGFFAADYDLISRFLALSGKDWEDEQLDAEIARAGPLTRALFKFIRQNHGAKPPRREQLYKKVLNHCFKQWIKDFRNERQPSLKHLDSDIKKRFLCEFFPSERIGLLTIIFPLAKDLKNSRFFIYKSPFFELIRNKDRAKEILVGYLDRMKESRFKLFEKEVYKFLQQMEQRMAKGTEDEVGAFFNRRHETKGGVRKTTGVKMPWAPGQLVEAVDATKLKLAELK